MKTSLRPLKLDDFVQAKAKVLLPPNLGSKYFCTYLFPMHCSPLDIYSFCCSVPVQVSPSVAFDATSMNELRKWNEQYGEGGSRSKSPFGFGKWHT
jgi:hypothetical protein